MKTGLNQTKPAHVESRRKFYDGLADIIRIDGIVEVQRDTAFDNKTFLTAEFAFTTGASLNPPTVSRKVCFSEIVGFDDVTPNTPRDISSWAYDYAARRVEIIDNRAIATLLRSGLHPCRKAPDHFDKIPRSADNRKISADFMGHYYDVYALLHYPEVQAFVGTDAYKTHKTRRFRTADNPNIAENQAFVLSDAATRAAYDNAYEETTSLYYRGKPTFDEILKEIGTWAVRL